MRRLHAPVLRLLTRPDLVPVDHPPVLLLRHPPPVNTWAAESGPLSELKRRPPRSCCSHGAPHRRRGEPPPCQNARWSVSNARPLRISTRNPVSSSSILQSLPGKCPPLIPAVPFQLPSSLRPSLPLPRQINIQSLRVSPSLAPSFRLPLSPPPLEAIDRIFL